MNKPWLVIGRMLNGWRGTGINISCFGGDLLLYVQESVEEALVYDGVHADRSAMVRHVFHGPTVDPSLPPHGVRRFSEADRKMTDRMLPGLQGAYETQAMISKSPAYGGLDFVGVGIFESLIRQIPGMKIGHVRSGEVVWL